jgi:ABC-type nickel/cobalt efflux system permease component RcnA
MILASHLHEEIARHGMVALAVLCAGGLLLLVARRLRRLRRSALAVAVIVVGLGVFELVETQAMSHNHICHNHHSSDLCSPQGAGEEHYRTHDHWLGSSVASGSD